MNGKISAAIEAERSFADLLDELKGKLLPAAIQDATPMPGVSPISSQPRCATVRFSALRSAPGLNLSPNYYLQDSQADAVLSEVESCQTVTELLDRLHCMIEQRKTAHGADAGTRLNDQTIQALQEFIA